MVELGNFKSYRSVDSDGICYVRGINRIPDYNLQSYDKYFKIYINDGIIYVAKYYKEFAGIVNCTNRFGFEELTVIEN
jgi:hypothetical protein